jgi:hypothetical protein
MITRWHFDALVTAPDAGLIEPARSKAYDELGIDERRSSIAVAWLRPTLFEGLFRWVVSATD